ncbi:MAG: hypothetical protein ACKVQS_14100 [Fimbriimonadaceae bacterium]
MDTLILGRSLVSSSGVIAGNVGIRDGRIVVVGVLADSSAKGKLFLSLMLI